MINYATYENYDELLHDGFVVVDFFSDSCGPCKVLARHLEDIAAELPFVNILKVNTSSHPRLGAENRIDAVPTLFFVRDGEILERVVGLIDYDELTEKIGEHYYG